ncbi:hypothetical protein FXN61_09380, partial [Lentzea sp. PSKA42]|nr:hypothetical protein [Lentzea indica]
MARSLPGSATAWLTLGFGEGVFAGGTVVAGFGDGALTLGFGDGALTGGVAGVRRVDEGAVGRWRVGRWRVGRSARAR